MFVSQHSLRAPFFLSNLSLPAATYKINDLLILWEMKTEAESNLVRACMQISLLEKTFFLVIFSFYEILSPHSLSHTHYISLSLWEKIILIPRVKGIVIQWDGPSCVPSISPQISTCSPLHLVELLQVPNSPFFLPSQWARKKQSSILLFLFSDSECIVLFQTQRKCSSCFPKKNFCW